MADPGGGSTSAMDPPPFHMEPTHFCNDAPIDHAQRVWPLIMPSMPACSPVDMMPPHVAYICCTYVFGSRMDLPLNLGSVTSLQYFTLHFITLNSK